MVRPMNRSPAYNYR